jgi:carboxylate-amine ligase
MSTPYTLGVEEEFHLVDLGTRDLVPLAGEIQRAAGRKVTDSVDIELYESMIETKTTVCAGLEEVRSQLGTLRSVVAGAAAEYGAGVLPTSTHPFSAFRGEPPGADDRYQRMLSTYRELIREQHIVGCHVHVGIPDPDEVIGVMNRARAWLGPLLALSVNSPYWVGTDTGFSSWRTQVWRRWPSSGTPIAFRDRAHFDAHIAELVELRVVPDATKLYWDLRPSVRYPTLEFRVADVCQTIDETVLLAGLFQAVARTCHEDLLAGEPERDVPVDVLRAAVWRSARDGMDAELVDVAGRRLAPAAEVVGDFLTRLRPALEAAGAWDEVSALATEVLERGTGAARQRAALARGGRLSDVVDSALVEG